MMVRDGGIAHVGRRQTGAGVSQPRRGTGILRAGNDPGVFVIPQRFFGGFCGVRWRPVRHRCRLTEVAGRSLRRPVMAGRRAARAPGVAACRPRLPWRAVTASGEGSFRGIGRLRPHLPQTRSWPSAVAAGPSLILTDAASSLGWEPDWTGKMPCRSFCLALRQSLARVLSEPVMMAAGACRFAGRGRARGNQKTAGAPLPVALRSYPVFVALRRVLLRIITSAGTAGNAASTEKKIPSER